MPILETLAESWINRYSFFLNEGKEEASHCWWDGAKRKLSHVFSLTPFH
jgi:hypothetical protein